MIPGDKEKENVDTNSNLWLAWGLVVGEGTGGTTGQPNQRSDTGKSSGFDHEQGWVLQASAGAWHSWRGKYFSPKWLSFAVAELEQCYQAFFTRDASSAQQGAGSEPRLHMGGGLTSWCCLPLELPL